MGAARLRYLTVVSMFHCTSSSDKSIMWLENSGSPCSLKYFSSASIMPSSQGSSFFAQWSVCRTTGMPYDGATARMYWAPAIEPAIEASWLPLATPLPAK